MAETGSMESDFLTLPQSVKQMTGPLFWLHGTETQQQLETWVDKVAQSGNGMLTTESRPHKDWLGEGWYRDLEIVINQAKKHDLKVIIFDDYWWPSQMMGGRVPLEKGCQRICAKAYSPTEEIPFECPNLIAAVAGKLVAPGTFDAASLKRIDSSWKAPEGEDWRVLIYTWEYAGTNGIQKRMISVNGLDSSSVDWFLDTVYKPHYDRFKDDFGKTIPGFFYDEPETNGDWGVDLQKYIAEKNLPLEALLTAYKFKLDGDAQNAALYAFLDARTEVWGKIMYGKTSDWCKEHNVFSTGHFMEHNRDFYSQSLSGGNMMQLGKYTTIPGIDLVCRQLYPGSRNMAFYQMPKISSSLAHVYNRYDGINMCETFGAYGQDITYPQMKWLCDWHQVRGCNMLIPHSFNPKAPYDRDCPPYFYNGGEEPRYPLYRVWANYTNRIAAVLSHGTHIAPIALVMPGQSFHCGETIRPEMVTSTLQDLQMDCDWVLYDAIESAVIQTNPRTKRTALKIANEYFDIMILPAVETIPYPALVKAKEFLDKGGIVMGYGIKPTKSATVGKSSADITGLFNAIFESGNSRACFLPDDKNAAQWAEAFAKLNVAPSVQIEGDENRFNIHVYQYVKDGKDVYYICNQNWGKPAKELKITIFNEGYLESWDAMQGTITRPKYERNAQTGACVATLTLASSQSALLVFNPVNRALPATVEIPAAAVQTIPVELKKVETKTETVEPASLFNACWIWEASQLELQGEIYLKTLVNVPENDKIVSAEFIGSCDNGFELSLNGKTVLPMTEETDLWRKPRTVNVAETLQPGMNEIYVKGSNFLPGPAGFIAAWKIELASGKTIVGNTQAESWQASVDGKNWKPACKIGKFGCGPWGNFRSNGQTLSPIPEATPGKGTFVLPVLKLGQRIFAAFENIGQEDALRIHVNNADAGGFICAPYHLDITPFVKPGENTILTEPFCPEKTSIMIVE